MDRAPDSDARLLGRIESDLSPQRLFSGNQGTAPLLEHDGQRLIVKRAYGFGPLAWLRRRMIRREFDIYRRLAGIPGVPRCYGLLHGRYLVLEYIEAETLRTAKIRDRNAYFDALLELIQKVHAAGVAHADLKRKENLLVVAGDRPCLIDFGVAVHRREGWHALNHALFRFACTLDLNAWVKLKYQRRYEQLSEADRAYYNPTSVEWLARRLRSAWRLSNDNLRANFAQLAARCRPRH